MENFKNQHMTDCFGISVYDAKIFENAKSFFTKIVPHWNYGEIDFYEDKIYYRKGLLPEHESYQSGVEGIQIIELTGEEQKNKVIKTQLDVLNNAPFTEARKMWFGVCIDDVKYAVIDINQSFYCFIDLSENLTIKTLNDNQNARQTTRRRRL